MFRGEAWCYSVFSLIFFGMSFILASAPSLWFSAVSFLLTTENLKDRSSIHTSMFVKSLSSFLKHLGPHFSVYQALVKLE